MNALEGECRQLDLPCCLRLQVRSLLLCQEGEGGRVWSLCLDVARATQPSESTVMMYPGSFGSRSVGLTLDLSRSVGLGWRLEASCSPGQPKMHVRKGYCHLTSPFLLDETRTHALVMAFKIYTSLYIAVQIRMSRCVFTLFDMYMSV